MCVCAVRLLSSVARGGDLRASTEGSAVSRAVRRFSARSKTASILATAESARLYFFSKFEGELGDFEEPSKNRYRQAFAFPFFPFLKRH